MTDEVQHNRQTARPRTGEAPFEMGEVFYSRTDRRGVIQSGNDVFRRVADYDWADLLGAPHKVIRHPDMPKGVFWILWRDLKAGEITGAYVKNRAKDGLYYWVFALITPAPGGYVSARIKPSSLTFGHIPPLYAKALAREQGEDLSPEDSAAAILSDLAEMGYETYRHFVVHAVSAEVQAERTALGLPAPKRVLTSEGLFSDARDLAEATAELVAEFEKLFHMPRNLQIRAARLEASGGPLSVLCQNYNGISSEMQNWFDENVSGENNVFSEISNCAGDALMLLSSAEVLHRCAAQLAAERRTLGGIDVAEERVNIDALTATYQDKSRVAYNTVAANAGRILDACQAMRRMLSGLDTIRIAFKIENARITETDREFSDIVQRLQTTQSRCEDLRSAIQQRAINIAQIAEELREIDIQDIDERLIFGPEMAAALHKAETAA